MLFFIIFVDFIDVSKGLNYFKNIKSILTINEISLKSFLPQNNYYIKKVYLSIENL